MNPLISVIIPVFNAETYLSACLDSVLSQSYRNIEVIIINDGSTDFSLEIAQKYSEQDDRVTVYSQENRGQSEARNHGLSVATGQLLAFVDADDILLPDALEVMVTIMLQYQADIVEGGIIYGDLMGQPEFKGKLKTRVYTSKQAIERVLYQKDMLPSPCGKLYKRNLFDNLRFVKGIIYEDLDIFYKVYAQTEKIAYINIPVYFYRHNEDSTTNTWKAQRLDVLKVTENLENYIREMYPDLLPAAKDRRLSANFNMFALCSIHGDHENASKCWGHIKQNRLTSLLNPKVRKKNKAGILLSYLGTRVFNLAARRIYK